MWICPGTHKLPECDSSWSAERLAPPLWTVLLSGSRGVILATVFFLELVPSSHLCGSPVRRPQCYYVWRISLSDTVTCHIPLLSLRCTWDCYRGDGNPLTRGVCGDGVKVICTCSRGAVRHVSTCRQLGTLSDLRHLTQVFHLSGFLERRLTERLQVLHKTSINRLR